jgi:hypothetical protein
MPIWAYVKRIPPSHQKTERGVHLLKDRLVALLAGPFDKISGFSGERD